VKFSVEDRLVASDRNVTVPPRIEKYHQKVEHLPFRCAHGKTSTYRNTETRRRHRRRPISLAAARLPLGAALHKPQSSLFRRAGQTIYRQRPISKRRRIAVRLPTGRLNLPIQPTVYKKPARQAVQPMPLVGDPLSGGPLDSIKNSMSRSQTFLISQGIFVGDSINYLSAYTKSGADAFSTPIITLLEHMAHPGAFSSDALNCFWQVKIEQFCHSKIEQVSFSFH